MADALVRELRVVIEREQVLEIGAGKLLERPKFTAQRLLIAQPQVPLVHFFTVYCKLLREEANVCSEVQTLLNVGLLWEQGLTRGECVLRGREAGLNLGFS